MAADKFVLDTKGLCLLCLSEMDVAGPNRQLTSTTSFKTFLRFLKIDIFQLKSFENSIFSSVSHLDNSCLTVSLCRQCGTMTNKFSERYTYWQRIGLELEGYLENIHSQMVIGDTDAGKRDEYSRRMQGSTHWKDVLNENVFQDLRKEAIDKCSSGISFSNLQHFASPSTDQATSTGSSGLGSFGTSSSTGGQAPEPLVDEPINPQVAPSPPLTQSADHVNNCVKEEVGVKVECFSPLPEHAGDDEESSSDEDMDTDELPTNSKEKEQGVVSMASRCSAAHTSHVVGSALDVFGESVECEDDESESPIVRRSARLQRDINKSVHKDGVVCDCPLCSGRFSSVRSLSLHMKDQNWKQPSGQTLADQSVKNSVCSQVSKNNGGLIHHMKAHAGEKILTRVKFPGDRRGHYKCCICGNIYTQARNRQIHLTNNHTIKFLEEVLPPGTTELRLESEIAREMLSMTRSRVGALKTYPLKCRHCPKIVPNKNELRNHIVIAHYDRFVFT